MVGVVTSNRCDNCRKRKKKCGEQIPSCLECIRSGWVCPGYKARWKFVHETPRLAKYYARRKFLYDDVYPNPDDQDTDGDLENDRAVVLGNAFFRYKPSYRRLEVPRSLDTNSLGSEFVYCLDKNLNGELQSTAPFFDFIPSRLGRNVALDDAVACMTAVYRDPPSPSHLPRKGVYRIRLKAISSLRKCISDPSLQMEPETLCATILLQLTELAINGGWSDVGWHDRGTGLLIRARGVTRYSSAFEYAMLESQLGHFISHSTRVQERCFLTFPEWEDLLLKRPTFPSQDPRATTLSWQARFTRMVIRLPSFTQTFFQLDGSQISQAESLTISAELMEKISSTIHQLKMLIDEAEPNFISYGDSQQTVRISYPNARYGLLDCSTNTVLIVLDAMLRSLWDKASQSNCEQPEARYAPADLKMVEKWKRRSIASYEFIKRESPLIAKMFNIVAVQ